MIRKMLAAAAMTVVALGLSQVVSAQHRGGCCQKDCGSCQDDCGGPKICVPKTETKKVAKPYYDCKCVQFCLPPKCKLCGNGQRGCGGCGECGGCNNSCGDSTECCAPRKRKVLIKKIKIEDECVTSCELKDGCAEECGECKPRHRFLNLHRKDCDSGCCPTNGCDGGTIIIPHGTPGIQGAEPIAPPKNIP